MIPIQLTLEGIYSYQKRQTIDFTALTDAGLFGIFGAVASGKSTILEAITFSLYGDSERMGGTNRNYNMMNLKSNRMYIDFEFLNFENKKYRAIKEYRRNSKSFNDVKVYSSTFYEWKDDDWIPLDHTNAETIIGLSAANFKRTIIIPQGKFKEFIELGGKDRTLMMKEIFNLHHYDLYNNARALYNANEHELNMLLGKISGYEDISEEIIKEKSKVYKEQKSIFDKNIEEHRKLTLAFEQLKQLNADFHYLQQQNKILASEEDRKKEIEEKEKSLKLYVQTHQQFDEILRLRQQISIKLAYENVNLNNIVRDLAVNQEKSAKTTEKLTTLKPFIDVIDTKKQEVVDLELIRQILTFRAAIRKGQERTTKGRTVVEELLKEVDLDTDKIKKTDIEIEDIKSKQIDANTLTSIELWFSANKVLTKQIEDRIGKLNDIIKQIDATDEKFQALGYDTDNWKETIEEQRKILDEQHVKTSKQSTELEVKEKIALFANEIHEGSACPLCGSLNHPHVIETEDVSVEILENKQQLKTLGQQIKLNAATYLELTKLQETKNNYSKNRVTVEAELKSLEEEKEQHIAQFVWDGFSAHNEAAFKVIKTENDKIIAEKDKLENQQKENRKQLDDRNKKLGEAKELLAKIEDENKYNETLIISNSNQIKLLQLSDYENQTSETVNETILKQKKLIKTNQDEHTALEKQKTDLLLAISSQTATKDAFEKQIAQWNKEENENNAIIESKFAESSFETLEAIEQLLSERRDVEAERAIIDSFKIERAKLMQTIEELEKRLEGKSFSTEEFEAKKEEFVESEELTNRLRETLATLKHDLERIEGQYKEKKVLLGEKEKLENRKTNISVLTKLFTANGFVNYVSSIYLKNLCAIANERFHRLTKNQLSLQINDKNEFEIIDYLNDGHSRSVKTLSGGQNFQVSLSLALALAENVQSLTNSEKNFFFIDEGFGTQDAESVNIVFETLSNLQKGNRIVGIISHVEELQERIPKSLFIQNDLDEGSLIEVIG